MSITAYMTTEHRACDEAFTDAEKAVIDKDFTKADTLFTTFLDETLRHFHKEETVLFPAFENETGMREGPTEVMRYEHEQMRELFSRMKKALDEKDSDTFLSAAESVMILMQQHNMKEEQMLYSMCDRALSDATKEETLAQMAQLKDW